MFTIAFYNAFGVAVTKNLSSLARFFKFFILRSVLDVTRTVLVWIIGMLLPNPARVGGKWEEFHGLELGGFIILVLGNFIYNEIIVLPFLGFNKYTREKLEEKALKRSMRKTSTNPLLNEPAINQPDQKKS